MRDVPRYSIVLATYGRGRCIAPTIESVLRQTFSDFELIVVGDGCNDETEETVRSFGSEKISWRNLPVNSGSQSFPNNEGIRHARGAWIAYIGHDDIWAPDHLRALDGVISKGAVDVVVSGCIYYGPAGSEVYHVTGLFDRSDAARTQFFPPSSIAHRRGVVDRIGLWRDPRSIPAPVDHDFLQRAVRAGMRFASTGRVTVHKFAAGHRYLSYLRQSDDEQRAHLAAGESEERNARMIEQAALAEAFTQPLRFYVRWQKKGRIFQQNRFNKGLQRPALRPLSQRATIAQTPEPRALDWYSRERGGFRWSGPNPRPKILIPFTGERAQAALRIVDMAPGNLSVFVEQQEIEHTLVRDTDGRRWLRFTLPLSRHDYTVVTLHTPMMVRQRFFRAARRVGIAAAELVVDPIA